MAAAVVRQIPKTQKGYHKGSLSRATDRAIVDVRLALTPPACNQQSGESARQQNQWRSFWCVG